MRISRIGPTLSSAELGIVESTPVVRGHLTTEMKTCVISAFLDPFLFAEVRSINSTAVLEGGAQFVPINVRVIIIACA